MSKILVFGPARTIETLTVPSVGASTEGISYETILGGQGESIAVALARLGARSVYCGRVGDDSAGKRLARLLDTAGVDLSCFRVDRSVQTSHVVREVDGENERRITFGGTDNRLSEEEIAAAFLSAPDAVCLSGELSAPLLSKIGALAAERSIPLFMLCTDPSVGCEAMPILHTFMTDEMTAEAITGIFPSAADYALKAAIELQKRITAKYYIIRQGDRGAFLYDGTYCHVVSAFTLPQSDLRGTDEAFFAAAVNEYLSTDGELQLALRYAAAAAALAATHAGEAVATPTADEILAFLDRS